MTSEASTYPNTVFFATGCFLELVPPTVIFCLSHYIHSKKSGLLFSPLMYNIQCVTMINYNITIASYLLVRRLCHHLVIIIQIHWKALKIQNICQVCSVQCVSRMQSIRIFMLHRVIIIKSEIWLIPLWLSHKMSRFYVLNKLRTWDVKYLLPIS